MNRKQVSEARNAKQFARTEKGNGATRWKVTLPGHDGKRYIVLLRGEKNGYSAECLIDAGVNTYPCPSCRNRHNGPCYHSMAAIMAAAEFNGFQVSFTDTYNKAERLARLKPDSRPLYLRRHGNNKQVWFVTERKKS